MSSASFRATSSARSPILFQGQLLKPGPIPGQWSQRYFVLARDQSELVLKWWYDSVSRVSGQSPAGCIHIRPSSTAIMKTSDILEISGIDNPEKPAKTRYFLRSSSSHHVDDCMRVLQRWMAAQGRERSVSLPDTLPPIDTLSPSVLRREDFCNLPPIPETEKESSYLSARVLFAYAAPVGHSDEISLPLGSLVHIFEQSDTGWWRGAVQGCSEQGWFPSNFVRPVSSRVIADKPECRDQRVLFYAVAIHDYIADSSEGASHSPQKELSIRTCDPIAVTVTHTNGWWLGTLLSGESGWFPSNYVEIVM